jgi:hypothetical protein
VIIPEKQRAERGIIVTKMHQNASIHIHISNLFLRIQVGCGTQLGGGGGREGRDWAVGKKLGIRPGSNPNIDTQTQFKVHSTPTETEYGLEK